MALWVAMTCHQVFVDALREFLGLHPMYWDPRMYGRQPSVERFGGMPVYSWPKNEYEKVTCT